MVSVFVALVSVFVASENLFRRCPKHTVQPPTRRSMRETKVNQKPGPVLVVTSAPSLFNSCRTSPKSAISMANAIRVKIAAKNATRDERRVIDGRVENTEKMNAKNVTMVATG